MNAHGIIDTPLESLGLSTRTYRQLRVKGHSCLRDVLYSEPAELASKSRTWADLCAVLKRLASKLDEEDREALDAFLEQGESFQESRAEARQNAPDLEVVPVLRPVLQELRRTAHPLPLRRLRRDFQIPRESFAKLQTEPFIVYPFGLHRWVGLVEWGINGYRKAARNAWNILPLHLQKLSSKGETLPQRAWQAISEVANERGDFEMLFLAIEELGKGAEATGEQAPETTPAAKDQIPPHNWKVPLAPDEDKTEREAPRTLPADESTKQTLSWKVPIAPDGPDEPLETREAPLSPKPEAPPVDQPIERKVATPQLSPSMHEALKASQPRVFAGVPKGDALKGVQALKKLADQQSTSFSLVELSPTFGDYQWITQWARTFERDQAEDWLNCQLPFRRQVAGNTYWSGNTCLGALVLFLATEVGRRQAREGEIWRHIPPLFSQETADVLFQGGQPVSLVRQAVEKAAKKLGVRNAFGQEGIHAWYQTIFLQFGFTRQGIPALPIWLTHLDFASSAVNRLHEESEVFQGLWTALKQYRSKKLSVEGLRKRLVNNPFILNSWISEICQEAKREIEGLVDDLVEGELPVFSVRLAWPDSAEPCFELTWEALQSMGLMESGYDVLTDEGRVGRLLLVDGVYQAVPGTFKVSLETPYVTVELEGDDGDDEQELDIVLWDTDESYHLFDGRSGERVSREKVLSVSRELFILTAPGVSVVPNPAVSTRLPGGYTLYSLEKNWSPLTAIHDRSGVVAQLETRARPVWIENCALKHFRTDKVFRFGEKAEVYLTGLPAEWEVESARAYGEPVDFKKKGHSWDATVPIHPSTKSASVTVRFTVRGPSGRFTFQRPAEIKLHDAAIKLGHETDWKPFRDLKRLTSSQLRQSRARVFLNPDNAHFGLMGGNTFLRRPPKRLATLELPGGYGEPLEIWHGPYNRLDRRDTFALSHEYVDTGLIEEFLWNVNASSFQVILNRNIEPGPDHFLLFWDSNGEVDIQTSDDFSHLGGAWSGYLETLTPPFSVALGYEDRCLGSFTMPRFEPPWDVSSQAFQTAGLLRWMKLPVLKRGWIAKARAFAQEHHKACLLAWVYDRSVRDFWAKLTYQDTEEWTSVVRQLFAEIQWEMSEAWNLWIQLLNERDDDINDIEYFARLLRAIPLQALALADELFNQQKLCELATGLAEAPAGSPRYKKRIADLAWEAGQDMGKVDSVFVESLLDERNSSTGYKRENFQLALSRPSFVTYLACTDLQTKIREGA